MTIPTTSKVEFHPQWKELLVCTMDGHKFNLELTMGILTAYLPIESSWETIAPPWAKGQWQRVKEDLTAWCLQQKIPLVIDGRAWVEFK